MRHLLPLFLALMSITANATPNVQSFEAAAFAAGSNQVPKLQSFRASPECQVTPKRNQIRREPPTRR